MGVGEAPICISSSPSRSNGTFELCVRRTGDLTRRHPQPSRMGDTLGHSRTIRPWFSDGEIPGKDILFAPGGMGLPQLARSINQVLDERGRYGRVIILYGARNPSELLFQG